MQLYFDPEYIPDQAERGSLVGMTKTPGYAVLNKILKSVVDKYLVELRDADTTKPDECVERVRRAGVAADIYQIMVDSINLYVSVNALADEAASADFNPDATAELAMDYSTDAEMDDVVSYFDLEEGSI
jgi:hypothetical protein